MTKTLRALLRESGLSETAVEITSMNKWYGDFHALRDIDLTVRRGERIVIWGRPAPANRP